MRKLIIVLVYIGCFGIGIFIGSLIRKKEHVAKDIIMQTKTGQTVANGLRKADEIADSKLQSLKDKFK